MLELQDFKDFSIHSWYQIFSNVTLKSIVIEISTESVGKMQDSECGDEIEEVFTEQELTVFKNALNSLNREGFVKNNWHAPIDAKAFSFGNTLKVTNLKDLILYLTASDIILKDFRVITGVPFHLVLKPWINIHPASEFRCIVINNILRAITPRDWPTYYAHFKEDGVNIVNLLTQFFNNSIKTKFPRKDYVFDVILTNNSDPPIILDFGPLNNKTNLYAFFWEELHPIIKKSSSNEFPPVFRFLENDIGIVTRSDILNRFNNPLSVL